MILVMENTFVKAALYAYPILKTVEKDYGEHIYNKAVLSYRSNKTAEELAEAIVQEILEKDKLVWLKSTIERALEKLNDVERALVAFRYFGKKRKPILENVDDAEMRERARDINKVLEWSDRKYFREQNRVCEKLRALFVRAGITREVFYREFLDVDWIRKICDYVERKKSCGQ